VWFVRAVGVGLGALLGTAAASLVLLVVLLAVNPNFDRHVSRYFWLAMLVGVVQTLFFALSYVWLMGRLNRPVRLPWAIASIAVVAVALVVPVEFDWLPLLAAGAVALTLTVIGSHRLPADDWIADNEVVPAIVGWTVMAVIAVGVVVLFLPRQTGFCASHDCIPNFSNGHGFIVQCADGKWSHSGGLQGACSYHGGEH
jgi:hypothetical protein